MTIVEKIKKGEFELFLHPKQRDGYIIGHELHQYLKDKNLLEDCATLKDLENIKKEGVNFFRKYFNGKFIYAWKSVWLDDGNLYAPYLYDGGDEVVLSWDGLDRDWNGSDPALRHASAQTSEINALPSVTLSLDSAIKICKDNGLVIYKPM